MQLDRTRIAVRERGGVDILDMSLHVLRTYFRHWLSAALVGILPFAVINAALLYGVADDPDGDFPYLYLWLMTMLVFVEAQWATAVVTVLIGNAVFDERTSVRQSAWQTWRHMPQLLWCQGVMRGVLPVLGLLALSRYVNDANSFPDGFTVFVLLCLILYAIAMRAFRPFINEIVVLERSPLVSKNGLISARKRSHHLHAPSHGDLMLRWTGAATVAMLLALAAIECLAAAQGVFFGFWTWEWFMLHLGIPAMLWLVAAFMAVVRFLNYLDLRIRHEGWEVELRLRAEAMRLASKLT